MTTFLQAVKLLYYYDENQIYWERMIDSVWAEFYANNPGAESGGFYAYIRETYGAEWNLWNFEKQGFKAIVFDSEQSKLLFALRFPGLE